ncbi:methyl-accepting chemotaxis protein [Archangium primigenium]|uniref:methyl-accepting chemotaxis protein n=1 Tax=[Archangium] primigenium TaxID=2792470 RepID=UPI00195DBB05|nr:methyl-accepting chemotaxis protein [Archangium primigenium]MBM7113805.1 methyl-accepting chemotaxis protein [Archangium primigenium]
MNGAQPQTVLPPQLAGRVFLLVALGILLSAPLTTSLLALSIGLTAEQMSWSLRYLAPPLFALLGLGLPWVGIQAVLRWGFSVPAEGDTPEQRMLRLQRLPWRLAVVGIQVPYVLGGLLLAVPLVVHFHKHPVLILLQLVVAYTVGQAMSLPVALKLEQLLMPFVLAQRERVRTRVTGQGLDWMRMRWYLPYIFASLLLSTLLLAGMALLVQTAEMRDTETRAVLEDTALSPLQAQLVAQHLRDFGDTLINRLMVSLSILGLFVLTIPTFSAWLLARRQGRAAEALQQAIERLSQGSPVAPAWASTDELGDVAMEMSLALNRLQEIPTRLQASASLLLAASTGLGTASTQQRERLSEQVAILQEAQLTSEEIRTTSELASHKAESVLSVAGHAEKLGQYGEEALERTLTGLNTIRDFVDGIRGKVLRLQESATQIAHIAVTVKDLADQSHLLALNASIEAARAGDQGAGFAVVASEIRKLADQTIRENALIRKSLLDIGTAIRDVVSMSEQGALQVEGGLERVKTSGNNLREMSLIIQENAAAVRQIAVAVNHQNTGISHIFNAIAHISSGMDETMKRLDTTLQATETLQAVTREVTEIAQRYQLQR